MMRQVIAAATIAAVLTACTPSDSAATSSSTEPTTTTIVETTTTTAVPADVGPVAPPVRHPHGDRSIYFVMTDRFENGDPSNDTGGIDGDALDHGFLPTDKGYYHGGDLAGLTARLPYLADLGMTAIWITPPFTNRPVQGLGEVSNSSAGYHGYWQIDWEAIDPHLGTEEEMQAFIAAAHDSGMAVIFDVVLNHTGDVIRFEEEQYNYRPQTTFPYLDADGEPFDPSAVAGSVEFPALTIDSFPYTPTFASEEDATVKRPDWLNDITVYHNRGDSTFSGESDTFGDFFGLDDLFTEDPRVVTGMIDLYTDLIQRYEIDGFRVDTVKHVNDEFWETFMPAVKQAAADAGRPDFLVYAEVFSSDPIFTSRYPTEMAFDAVLDFRFHDALTGYVANGLPASVIVDTFDDDDWYLDTDSNASMAVTFFGNHDISRMGRLIDVGNAGASADELLARMRLGFDLLMLSRGIPVVYYGDEQGFVGVGGDRDARQSMFPSQTSEYDRETIGSDATPADENFDADHPLHRHVAGLNTLRADHPALATGAHIVHPAADSILAFSRIDRDERLEYLVIANNSEEEIGATIPALTPDTSFTPIWPGAGDPVTSGPDGSMQVTIPALSAVVLVAAEPLPVPEAEPAVTISRPDDGAEIIFPRYRIEAAVGDRRYAEVTFAVRAEGDEPRVIGTDDAAPFRVYWDTTDLPDGATVEIIATVDDGSGRLRSDSVTVTMGAREGT